MYEQTFRDAYTIYVREKRGIARNRDTSNII